jgi:hypothetical protein
VAFDRLQDEYGVTFILAARQLSNTAVSRLAPRRPRRRRSDLRPSGFRPSGGCRLCCPQGSLVVTGEGLQPVAVLRARTRAALSAKARASHIGGNCKPKPPKRRGFCWLIAGILSLSRTTGIGKSTIALSVAAPAGGWERFGARRFHARCDQYTDTASMIAGLDAAWFSRVVTDPRGALLAALAEGPAVVLLDNFETPWRPDRGKAEEFVAAPLGIQNLWLAMRFREKSGRGISRLQVSSRPLDGARSLELFRTFAGISEAETIDPVIVESFASWGPAADVRRFPRSVAAWHKHLGITSALFP